MIFVKPEQSLYPKIWVHYGSQKYYSLLYLAVFSLNKRKFNPRQINLHEFTESIS